jgi:hypothetical protein
MSNVAECCGDIKRAMMLCAVAELKTIYPSLYRLETSKTVMMTEANWIGMCIGKRPLVQMDGTTETMIIRMVNHWPNSLELASITSWMCRFEVCDAGLLAVLEKVDCESSKIATVLTMYIKYAVAQDYRSVLSGNSSVKLNRSHMRNMLMFLGALAPEQQSVNIDTLLKEI